MRDLQQGGALRKRSIAQVFRVPDDTVLLWNVSKSMDKILRYDMSTADCVQGVEADDAAVFSGRLGRIQKSPPVVHGCACGGYGESAYSPGGVAACSDIFVE